MTASAVTCRAKGRGKRISNKEEYHHNMANTWKYASLPEAERMERIRGGDGDVYKNEIERAVDVARSREELGLSIDEQKNFIDEVSYHYNLAAASKMGIPAESVNRTGYADRILGENYERMLPAKDGKKQRIVSGSKSTRFMKEAEKLLEALENDIAALDQKRESTKEWLTNNGIAPSSEDGKKFLAETEKEIEDEVKALQKKFHAELKSKM